MRLRNSILALLLMLSAVASVWPSTFDFATDPAPVSMRWHARTIRVALSTSLTSPNLAIKPGSDVTEAVRRALKQWSSVADIKFVEVPSKLHSVSPVSAGDGINLITIAATSDNLAMFTTGEHPARTRVFYDSETGEISEADIVINPFPYSEWGLPLQFSTDGTPGTYDLESTFAHEIGHLLGLDHSNLISSTMNPCQALNGVYGVAAFTQRTLSEADQQALRSIYGPGIKEHGAIEGHILNSFEEGRLVPVADAHIWVESLASGGIVASTQTGPGGAFRIDGVPTGEYRILIESRKGSVFGIPALSDELDDREPPEGFRSVEISSRIRVTSQATSTVDYVLVPPHNTFARLTPRFIGTNGELSIVPLPGRKGSTITLYLAGEGVDQVPGSGISITSPFLTVDAATLKREDFDNGMPVISIRVTISDDAPSGDYSIRLQAHWGEVAYVAGGITIDPS